MVQAEAAGRRGPYAKSAAKREAIVAAAAQVFAENGYHAGSLREVAGAAGMSMSTLMHHFGRKEDLLLAVLAERDKRRLEPDQYEPGDFASLVVAQARANESVPGLVALYSVLAAESTTRDHPARGYFSDRFDRMREQYTAEFEALSAAGRLRAGVDPRTAADNLVAMWDGMQLRWLLQPDEVDVAAALRSYFELVID
jgi:AcrR family transcriptional regulator